jgi:hypothetical protein
VLTGRSGRLSQAALVLLFKVGLRVMRDFDEQVRAGKLELVGLREHARG